MKRRRSTRPRKTHHVTRPIAPEDLEPVFSPDNESAGMFLHRLSRYNLRLYHSRQRFYRFTTTPDWEGHIKACAGANLAMVEASRGARNHP